MSGAAVDHAFRVPLPGEHRPGSVEDGAVNPLASLDMTSTQALDRSESRRGLRLEDPQHLISDTERVAYEHLTGLLLDTAISGVIRNEYLYLSSSLNGEIVVGDGTVFDFSVSDTFVSFASRPGGSGSQSEDFIETDGEPLDSSEITKLFQKVSTELLFKDLWSSHSGLTGFPDVTFGTVQLDEHFQQVYLPVETRYGEWTVELRKQQGASPWGYSLTDTERGVRLTRRTTDSVLSDIAEACGKDPSPFHVLNAMATVAMAAIARLGAASGASLSG